MKYLRKFNESSDYILDGDDIQTIREIFMDLEDEFDIELTSGFGLLDSSEYRISWYYDSLDMEEFGDVKISDEKKRSFGISIFGRIDPSDYTDEFVRFVESLIERVNSIYKNRCKGDFYKLSDGVYFSYILK
jgi:hypothetical protein